MRRRPEDITLGAIAGGVMLATSAAAVLIGYAMLSILELVPPSLVTEEIVRLAR